MRCVLIDNYDSFTYNLADSIGRTFNDYPVIVRNDQLTWDELRSQTQFDCVVISPGPGSVVNKRDVNTSRQAIAQNDLPVFGVCLGFQGIGYHYGSAIQHCDEPFHGRTSVISHQNDTMFAHIPSEFEAVRYHSLQIALPQHSDIIATAHSSDGIIQGIRHNTLPKWGVQFHPESVLTSHGDQLIRNFRDLAHQHIKSAHSAQIAVPARQKSTPNEAETARSSSDQVAQSLNSKPLLNSVKPVRQVISKKLNIKVDSALVFATLFGDSEHCFWLDSQVTGGPNQPRFSYMGSVLPEHIYQYQLQSDEGEFSQGQHLLKKLNLLIDEPQVQPDPTLPFDFVGGLVGYLGYEMKALFSRKFPQILNQHQQPEHMQDMVWMHVERFIAFDHLTQSIYVVACCKPEEAHTQQNWLDTIAAVIAQLVIPHHEDEELSFEELEPIPELKLTLNASQREYLSAINACKHAIIEGESYEVCLTNQFSTEIDIDPFELYLQLRADNAAPFGSFIRHGETSILSTSPERFLNVAPSGVVQSKPIKGTIKRASDANQDAQLANKLANSVKDRAENLMIVDLMRNDLNRVSVANSVRVPKLMDIESYETVHQMVSTVESDLAPNKTLFDLLAATFPGGSISGAPKCRTMEIIDELETSARGVYCGAIGYLGYNKSADLNIGIRTLSYDGKTLRFGAGGAITQLSDPHAEFDEIMLKAEALLKPLWAFLGNDPQTMQVLLDGRQVRIR